MSVVHNLQNDTRLADFEAFVKECGEDSARGKDALPTLAVGFVRAVYDGVVDAKPDKNGDGAAARYFKKYCAAEGKKAYHDRSVGSVKAQTSKLKQLEKAASNPKFDFVDVLNRTVGIYQTAHDDGVDLKSPFPAYVDVAREQLKLDDELDDAMILAAITAGNKTKEVTLESQLKKVEKILNEIVTGENKHGIKDQSPELIQAQENVSTRITTLLMTVQLAEASAKAAEAEAYLQK